MGLHPQCFDFRLCLAERLGFLKRRSFGLLLLWVRCFIFGLHIFVGGGLGWISTLIVPQLFLPFLWMRLANFVVAPLVAGGISYAFATWAKSRGNNHDPAGHFLHGCLFALMFGVARYAFAVR